MPHISRLDPASVGRDEEELRANWKALAKNCDFQALGASSELIAMWERAPAQVLDQLASLWNLAESVSDMTALLRLASNWAAQAPGGYRPHAPHAPHGTRECLRIGFLTTVFDIRIRRLVEPVLDELAQFHDVTVVMVLAQSAGKVAQRRWRVLTVDAAAPAAQQSASIRTAGFDILIDLNGLQQVGSATRLLAGRPAPCCIVWTGRPLPIPAALADWQVVDPSVLSGIAMSGQAKPLVLPESWAFLGEVPEPALNDAYSAGTGRLCCPSAPMYVRPDALRAWARILASGGHAVLVFTHEGFGAARARSNLERAFMEAGGASTQIAFETDSQCPAWASFDFVLATYPVMGPLTLVEALGAGVPAVVRAGPMQPQRMAASILHNAQATQLVASNWDGYIDIATGLLRRPMDEAGRAGIRQMLSRSAACNSVRFARQFRQAIEQATRVKSTR